MKKCNNESKIDDYLLNRMSEDERESFEIHYFTCPVCFEKIVERNELISVIKDKGRIIFEDIQEPVQERKPSILESITALVSPKQWAVAAVSAALILVIAIGFAPNLKKQSPQFFIDDDLVRGESITLISPVINIDSVPDQFTWKNSGKDVEYKIYIYNSHPLWTAITKNTSITLPEAVQAKMVPGEKYSWQVKSFSPEGTLIAVSRKVQFQITN
jgi:hypothetical protein